MCSDRTKQLSLGIEQLDRIFARKFILKDKIKPTGADVTDDQYNRFLKLAVKSRDTPLVRALLEARPQVDGTVGAELLWEVVDDANTRIAEMLVQACADVNKSFDQYSTSLLHVLAKSNDRKKCELAVLMIKHGAKVTAVDARRYTVCEFAIKYGNLAFAQELLKRGVAADKNLMCMTVYSPSPIESMLLLVNGDHVEDHTTRSQLVKDAFKCLCRFKQSEGRILDMVAALLDLQIPPMSAIFNAVRCNNSEIVELLLERTDIDESTKMMFLGEAVISNRSTMARLLIEWGADIEHKDSVPSNRGMRPLHFACLYRSQQNIRLLLHLGADVNAVDHYDMTPFAFLILNLELVMANGFSDKQLTETCRLVAKHFALLISKSSTVNEHDLAIIQSYPILQHFYDECLAELQATKRTKIISGISFHSIFTKSIQELSVLLRRPMFSEGYNDRLNSFPVYCSDLDMRVQEAERRKKLLLPKEDAIYESLHEILPDIPIENIIQYLYLDEVETLKDRLMMLK